MLRNLGVLVVLLLLPSVANAEKLSVEIDGYRPGEVTLNDVFARLTDTDKRGKLNTIIDDLVSAEANPSAGKTVVVVIIGHADRQDNLQQFPTPEARRANELQASIDRVVDANDFLLRQVQSKLRAIGAVPPPDFDSARNIAVAKFAAGAADLKHPVPRGEAQRLQNRRVGFFMQSFPR